MIIASAVETRPSAAYCFKVPESRARRLSAAKNIVSYFVQVWRAFDLQRHGPLRIAESCEAGRNEKYKAQRKDG
jgi:hypothetical protein